MMYTNLSLGQKDTTIENRTYTVLERHTNENIKYIGQFNTTCLDDTIRKHGYFIKFDIQGNEIEKKTFILTKNAIVEFLG